MATGEAYCSYCMREGANMSIANLAFIVLIALMYGGFLLCGGFFWYLGWRGHNEGMSRAGDLTVFLGLCVDFVLLSSRQYFDWMEWLQIQLL